eukprot:gene13132-15153_t
MRIRPPKSFGVPPEPGSGIVIVLPAWGQVKGRRRGGWVDAVSAAVSAVASTSSLASNLSPGPSLAIPPLVGPNQHVHAGVTDGTYKGLRIRAVNMSEQRKRPAGGPVVGAKRSAGGARQEEERDDNAMMTDEIEGLEFEDPYGDVFEE